MKQRLALDNSHIYIQCEERNYTTRLQRPALEAVQSHSRNDKIRNAWGFFPILHTHNFTVGLAVHVREGGNLRSFLKKSCFWKIFKLERQDNFTSSPLTMYCNCSTLFVYLHCLFSRLMLSSVLPNSLLFCSFLFLIICVCLSISHRSF